MAMGFRFGRSQGMEGSTSNLRDYAIDPADTQAIFTGDLVKLNATTGFLEVAAASSSNDFDVIGIFWGASFVGADGGYNFVNQWDGGAGRTNIQAQVVGPSGATFICEGTPGQTYTQADIGVRKGVVYAAGNAATGMSGMTLGAAGATVATGPLRVIQEVDIPEITDPLRRFFEVSVIRSQAFGTEAAA